MPYGNRRMFLVRLTGLFPVSFDDDEEDDDDDDDDDDGQVVIEVVKPKINE